MPTARSNYPNPKKYNGGPGDDQVGEERRRATENFGYFVSTGSFAPRSGREDLWAKATETFVENRLSTSKTGVGRP